MKTYKVAYNNKYKICMAIFFILLVFGINFSIETNDFKLLFLLLPGGIMIMLSILFPFIKKPIIYVNDESVSIIPLIKTVKRSIKYQDINQVVYDDFLGLFSLIYLFPKEMRWRKGVVIISGIEDYKNCISEILSHLPSTTWIDPEVYKFLNAKPKTIKEQLKRISYVSMIAVIIFLIIMIAAVLLTYFKIQI